MVARFHVWWEGAIHNSINTRLVLGNRNSDHLLVCMGKNGHRLIICSSLKTTRSRLSVRTGCGASGCLKPTTQKPPATGLSSDPADSFAFNSKMGIPPQPNQEAAKTSGTGRPINAGNQEKSCEVPKSGYAVQTNHTAQTQSGNYQTGTKRVNGTQRLNTPCN